MSFQKTVIIVATIILIGLLVFVGYAIQKEQSSREFPPVIGECPDYWNVVDNKCQNTKNLGTCKDGGPKDFNVNIYQGDAGNCEKSTWAKNCGLVWDGITNNPTVCNLSQ